MEAVLGISLYSYLYLRLAKNALSFLLSLMFSLQQNWRRGQNRFCLENRRGREEGEGVGGLGGEMVQTMNTHMNKCINNFLK
jgi:hypothetical protein